MSSQIDNNNGPLILFALVRHGRATNLLLGSRRTSEGLSIVLAQCEGAFGLLLLFCGQYLCEKKENQDVKVMKSDVRHNIQEDLLFLYHLKTYSTRTSLKDADPDDHSACIIGSKTDITTKN